MIGKFKYDGEDFKVVMAYEGWRIGILRNSERFSASGHIWERHLLTDEAFVLHSVQQKGHVITTAPVDSEYYNF